MKAPYIIAYLDIVDYSTTDESKQVHQFKSLQKEINYIISDEMHENCILIPTGDGMIVGIKDIDTATCLESIEFMIKIYNWAEREGIKMRGSLHAGTVNVLKDINRHENIIGTTINNAARLLGGAADNSIIISNEYYEKYLRQKGLTIGIEAAIDKYRFTLCDEDTIIDKHGYKHHIYSVIFKESEKQCGSEEKILNKYKTSLYSDEYPKSLSLKDFNKKVKTCTDIKLVGIYHPGTPEILEHLDVNKLRKVNVAVYYPSDALKENISEFFQSDVDKLSFKNKERSINEITQWYNEHPHKDNIILNLYEYDEFLPFGASTLNINSSGNGFIHISNYLNGVIPDKTPYIVTEWLTVNKPPLYEFYSDYLYKMLFNKDLQRIDISK